MMRQSTVAAVGCALFLLLGIGSAQAQTTYTARLDTVPIDPRTQAATTGSGTVTARLVDGELRVSGSFDGLAGAATIARLHLGAAVGARGPALQDLTVTQALRGEVQGVVRLNRRQVDALESGRLYVQIHSQSAPEGNLWGWLLPQE